MELLLSAEFWLILGLACAAPGPPVFFSSSQFLSYQDKRINHGNLPNLQQRVRFAASDPSQYDASINLMNQESFHSSINQGEETPGEEGGMNRRSGLWDPLQLL